MLISQKHYCINVEMKRVVPNLSHLRICPYMRYTSVIMKTKVIQIYVQLISHYVLNH